MSKPLSNEHQYLIAFAICWTVLLVSLFALWVSHSYFEARAYARVTGKYVSTWDAMFLELRIQEPARRD